MTNPALLLALIFGTSLIGPAHAKNQDPAPLPPKVLYHVGQKKHLLENERNGEISQDVWDDFIMGRKTRFGLVPYRRGFYGASKFEVLEMYGNAYYGTEGAKVPWALKFTLKDECRTQDAASDLATDPAYLSWLLQNSTSLLKNADFCLNAKAESCRDIIIGTQPIANGREENVCDDLLQEFLTERNVRVVRDSEWEASWYVRDRSCIEKMDASPNTMLEMLADAAWDWDSRRDRYSFKVNGYGTFGFDLLLRALAESRAPASDTLERLREKLAGSDIRADDSLRSPQWLKSAGPAAIDAFRRCQKAAKMTVITDITEQLSRDLSDLALAKKDGPLLREKALDRATGALSSACR